MDEEYRELNRLLNHDDIPALFEFLRNMQYIQYDSRVQARLWKYVHNALKNPDLTSYHTNFEELRDRIHHMFFERKAHISPESRVLGKGSYGCVIQPALPNHIGSEWIEHPKNVTKLFKDPTFQRKAVSNSRKIAKVMENDAYVATPQIAYQASNFSPNIQSNCNLSPNSYAYAARMPNAGISIASLPGFEAYFASIPVRIILEQCKKLFEQVQILLKNNTVHGDLHAGNVMVHPETGMFTLIDFDWYLPKDEFFHKYNSVNGFGHYSNPPESLLMFSLTQWIILPIGPPSMESPKMEQYIQQNNSMYFRRMLHTPILKSDLQSANMDNFQYANKDGQIKKLRDFFDVMFPTFDSYGLAQSLLNFCAQIYPYRKGVDDFPQTAHLTNRGVPYTEQEHEKLRRQLKHLYDHILLPMIDIRMGHRFGVAQAIADLQILLHEEAPSNNRRTLRSSKKRPMTRKGRRSMRI